MATDQGPGGEIGKAYTYLVIYGLARRPFRGLFWAICG